MKPLSKRELSLLRFIHSTGSTVGGSDWNLAVRLEKRGLVEIRPGPKVFLTPSGENAKRTGFGKLSGSMGKVTQKQLASIGLSYDETVEIEHLIRIATSSQEHDDVDRVLDKVDTMINGHGVEALHESDAYVDRYYQDIIGLYVNRGDTYKATLLFDTENFEFHVTSWGDFYEEWEKRQVEEETENVDRDAIVEAAARAFFVMDWADRESEKGRNYPGEDLMDVAPDTSKAAEAFGEKFIKKIEEQQKNSIERLYVRAATDDSDKHLKEPTPEDFGHYLAMQALGHGVSWEDDHPKLGWRPPHVEFYEGEGSGL